MVFLMVLVVVWLEVAHRSHPGALRLFLLETRWKLQEWLDRCKGRK